MLTAKEKQLSTLLIFLTLTDGESRTHQPQRSHFRSAIPNSECIHLPRISLKLYSTFLTIKLRNKVLAKYGKERGVCVCRWVPHSYRDQPSNWHCLGGFTRSQTTTNHGELNLPHHSKNSTSRLTHAPSCLCGNPPLYTWKASDLKEAKHQSQSKQWDRMSLDTKHGHSDSSEKMSSLASGLLEKNGNKLKNVWLALSNYSCTRECDLQGWRT